MKKDETKSKSRYSNALNGSQKYFEDEEEKQNVIKHRSPKH